MKGGNAPDSPNPAVTIPLQQQANKDTFNYMLDASRANTYTPYGSLTWSNTPTFDQQGYQSALDKWGKSSSLYRTTGEYQAAKPTEDQFTSKNWTYNTQLSPDQQKLFDANTQSQIGQANLLGSATQRVADANSSPIDFSGVNDFSNYTGDFMKGLADRSQGNDFNQQMADATYGLASRYLDPQLTQQKNDLQSNLAAQGFVPGTPGYDRAMQNYMDTSNRAYGQARDSAITAGYGQANTRLQQMQAIASLLGNRQNQMTNQIFTERNAPLNELNALRTGAQVQLPTGQSTYSTPNLAPVDMIGAYNQDYQNKMNQYSANVAGNNQLLGDATGLLATAMMPGSTGLFTGMAKLFGG